MAGKGSGKDFRNHSEQSLQGTDVTGASAGQNQDTHGSQEKGARTSMGAFNRYLWNADYERDTVLCSWAIHVNKANVPTLWSFTFCDKT